MNTIPPPAGILDVRAELEYLGKGGVPDEAALVRVAASVQVSPENQLMTSNHKLKEAREGSK